MPWRTSSSCRPSPSPCPLKFQREGIKYDNLSEEEKEQWDAKEWSEDGTTPDYVEAEAVNKWLFNKDTVDKVLAHLMTRGQKVAGGDRLGKTIIFAKNQAARRFHPGAVRYQLSQPGRQVCAHDHLQDRIRPKPD